MDFNMSERQTEWLNRVRSFMNTHVRPAVPIYKQQDAEGSRWKVIPILEDLKKKAKAEGLWNMFMPPNSHEDDEFRGAGLTNLEYAPLAEEMGHIGFASEVSTVPHPIPATWKCSCAMPERAEAQMAASADDARSACLPDDGACRGVVRCQQYRDADREGRRSLRHQRPQMVVVRVGDPHADRDPDGQDRSQRGAPSGAVADPGAADTPASSKRSRRCSASTTRRTAMPRCCSRMSAFPRKTSAREGRVFDRAGPPVRAASITAAHHRRGRRGAAKMVQRLSSRTAFGKKIIEHRSGTAHRRSPHRHR